MSWVKTFSIYCFEICWFAFYSCNYTYYCCSILISFSCIKISFLFLFLFLKIFKRWKSRGWKLATFILVFKKIPVMEIFYGISWLCNESQLDSWFCDFWRGKNLDCCNGLESSGAGWVPLEKANRVDNLLWDWWQGSCSWKWNKNIWEHPQQRSWAF